jgi:hypothetical protein
MMGTLKVGFLQLCDAGIFLEELGRHLRPLVNLDVKRRRKASSPHHQH